MKTKSYSKISFLKLFFNFWNGKSEIHKILSPESESVFWKYFGKNNPEIIFKKGKKMVKQYFLKMMGVQGEICWANISFCDFLIHTFQNFIFMQWQN